MQSMMPLFFIYFLLAVLVIGLMEKFKLISPDDSTLKFLLAMVFAAIWPLSILPILLIIHLRQVSDHRCQL